MQKKFLFPALVLVALLTALAFLGIKTREVSPVIGYSEEKQVYLTFDDGPSTVVTGSVLNTLKEENVKATFFIVSDRVFGREEILKREKEEGHTIGVHSKTHEYSKIYASDEALLKDVAACAKVIESVANVKPTVYRFPGGGSSKKEHHKKLLNELGYTVVGWNAVCGDEEIPRASAERLLQETIKTSSGKQQVVLLLHDSAPHKQTAKALKSIIDYFKKEGFRFCAF